MRACSCWTWPCASVTLWSRKAPLPTKPPDSAARSRHGPPVHQGLDDAYLRHRGLRSSSGIDMAWERDSSPRPLRGVPRYRQRGEVSSSLFRGCCGWFLVTRGVSGRRCWQSTLLDKLSVLLCANRQAVNLHFVLDRLALAHGYSLTTDSN